MNAVVTEVICIQVFPDHVAITYALEKGNIELKFTHRQARDYGYALFQTGQQGLTIYQKT